MTTSEGLSKYCFNYSGYELLKKGLVSSCPGVEWEVRCKKGLGGEGGLPTPHSHSLTHLSTTLHIPKRTIIHLNPPVCAGRSEYRIRLLESQISRFHSPILLE